MDEKISIAIDGPAGAGKSTLARLLAKKLNLIYIDTGAMYRAFTLKILNKNIDINNKKDIINEIKNTEIDFKNNHIYLDEKIVDKQIRKNIVSKNVSNIAKIEEVRNGMVKLQKEISQKYNVVMDGRDIGTVVLPNASFKFFITASIKERSKRRYIELVEKGEKNITFEEIEQEILNRDKIDSTRKISPLKKSDNSIEIDTTNKTIKKCIQEITKIIEGR